MVNCRYQNFRQTQTTSLPTHVNLLQPTNTDPLKKILYYVNSNFMNPITHITPTDIRGFMITQNCKQNLKYN